MASIDEYSDEAKEIAENYGVDLEEAEEIEDLANEHGLDWDDAHMVWEES